MKKLLKINNSKLYEKSIKDPLTSLYNREFMSEFLTQKIEEAYKHNLYLSVAMIDIDFFKSINDSYGHLIGDCVLKELSQLLLKYFRSSDTIIRYGGEEILIVMPFTHPEESYERMETFREIVQNHLFCEEKIHITISVGVGELSKLKKENLTTLIKKTDEKLYIAKKSGRNRVIY